MFKWFFAGVNLLFLVWTVNTLVASPETCEGLSGEMLQACQDGTAIGTGLGLMMILFLWVVTDGILLMLRLVFRRKEQAAA